MTRRAFDPLHLDVAAFAQEGAALAGTWPMADLGRLQQSQSAPHDATAETVRWRVRGESREAAGEAVQTWLHLQADAPVWLACQRCLAPMRVDLSVDVPIRFVRGEAQAEALDAESEFDVLALAPAIDLRQLVEDELLLALPLVPRHEACPMPMAGERSGDANADASRGEHPFSVLAGLKSRRGA
ncbi:MAG: YceD family protein [Burkholderiaceae bacterium]